MHLFILEVSKSIYLNNIMACFLKYGHIIMLVVFVVLLTVIIILLTKYEYLILKIKQDDAIQVSKRNQQLNETLGLLYEYFLQWKKNMRDWDNLLMEVDLHCNAFVTRLRKCYPKLTEQDLRFCVLIFLKVPRKLIAESLHMATSGISKKKCRIAQSMGVETVQFRAHLVEMCLKNE